MNSVTSRQFEPWTRRSGAPLRTYEVTFDEQDAACAYFPCDEPATVVLVVQRIGSSHTEGRVAAYCDEHVEGFEREAGLIAARNVASRKAKADQPPRRR